MRIRNKKGQSLIELLMILPIIIGFWVSIVYFARVFIIDIELLHTARHGVFWLSYQTDRSMSSGDEEASVQTECQNFLHAQDPSLDLNRLTIEVHAGDRWKPVRGGMAAAIVEFLAVGKGLVSRWFIAKMAGVDSHTSPASVTLQYSLDAPPFLSAIPGFPSTIPLRGYCVCYR